MTHRTTRSLISGILAGSLVLAACSSDDGQADVDDAVEDTDGQAEADTTDRTASDDETTAEATNADESNDDESMDDEAATDGAAGDLNLADVCPETIVIQTDWFPEAEHGSLYQMVGEDYTYDAEQQRTKGSLVAGADMVDTGVDIEVRAGGPAIGFAPPRAQIYTDDSITIAYANTDAQAQSMEDQPLIAVAAPLEINPQIVMWDAETYPDVKTIQDVGAQGMTINLFDTLGFAEAFVAQGIWSEDQLDPSYDGAPQRFIADRTIAQQGFASSEPYDYEFVFEEYGKAPAYQLLHDAGWEIYAATLNVRPDQMEALSPCLAKFVPIVQQATIEFSQNPDRVLDMIVDIVTQTDSFWAYDRGKGDYAVETMNDLGLNGNGPDDIVANIDEARWQKILDTMRDAGMDLPDDLTAADMFTNEFIDPSIGF